MGCSERAGTPSGINDIYIGTQDAIIYSTRSHRRSRRALGFVPICSVRALRFTGASLQTVPADLVAAKADMNRLVYAHSLSILPHPIREHPADGLCNNSVQQHE